MSLSIMHRTTNRPVVAALWALTLFALIPFPNLACILLGAAANLTANGLALYLICSRSRTDRVHGFVRLSIQIIIVVAGVIALARSGVSLEGFYRYVAHRTI